MKQNKLFIVTICFACIIILFLITSESMNPALAVESILELDQKWIGDFDEMVERHKIRVLVPYSKTFFFLDGAKQVGVAYEGMKIFEKWLNQEIVCEQYLQVLYRLQDDYGTARGTK